MMKPRILYSMMILLCAGVSSFAQNIERVYMRSGSEVEGYVSEQLPGVSITINSSKATVVVNSDSLVNRYVERVPLESLSEEWIEWAEGNDTYVVENGTKILELSTLTFNKTEYSGVFVLERGSLIKFLDLNPNEYSFAWGDMYRTVKHRRPDTLFSGLKETIVLKDGSRISGQIIEQLPGQDLKILTEDGEVLSYKYNQIIQILAGRLNDRLPLWSQIQLLDVVQVKGESEPMEGFISSRTMSKELVLEFEDGRQRILPMEKVASYAKVPNEKYYPVYDKALKEGEILLNGETAYFDNLKVQDNWLLLSDDIASAHLTVGDHVCIEANLPDSNVQITLVKARMENFSKKKRKPMYRPAVSFQDLVRSPLTFSREITPLGNVKIEFDVEETGDYVLYIQGVEGYIVLYVTESI